MDDAPLRQLITLLAVEAGQGGMTGHMAEVRSLGFSRKDKCPDGISAFEGGIKSASS